MLVARKVLSAAVLIMQVAVQSKWTALRVKTKQDQQVHVVCVTLRCFPRTHCDSVEGPFVGLLVAFVGECCLLRGDLASGPQIATLHLWAHLSAMASGRGACLVAPRMLIQGEARNFMTSSPLCRAGSPFL